WYDRAPNLVHFVYVYEKGRRLRNLPPMPPPTKSKLGQRILAGKTVVANTRAAQRAMHVTLIPGTEPSLSVVAVPVIGSSGVIAAIGLEDFEHENAYGKHEVALLETIAES